MPRHFSRYSLLVLLAASSLLCAEETESPDDAKVSYYKQIRPIFQAHCQGCHQPAKANGDYVMTSFDRLVIGGESGAEAVIAGKPDNSYLMDLIVPVDGEAEMPRGKEPLAESEVALIRRWIEEGASDDTPANARQRFDMKNLPVYTRPPVIASIDFSPDGKLLAIAGFHEVLLAEPDSSKVVARLVGMSERIESVQFSPDGKRLAVTGGLPGRMGEVQVWNVEDRSLELSVPVTYDTIYGGSWSPDGKLISFGCADNTLRAIDAETGKQVLFQGAHSDWVRDTVFAPKGTHVLSVGRDMTVKLTEVATERFVDNVTSITPGALKGGVTTIARHPERDEVVIGGSDGVVKVYRIFRQTKRVIGDDANLIRKMPGMTGRVFSVAVSKDGKRIAAGSSLNGAGQVHVYSYEFDTSLPNDIKGINQKVVTRRSADEKKKLAAYHKKDVKLIASIDVNQAGIYAVAFHPDGKTVAAAGSDGVVRLIDAASGEVLNELSPAPISEDKREMSAVELVSAMGKSSGGAAESLPDGFKLDKVSAIPTEIQLNGKYSYVQLLANGESESQELVDVTRIANISITGGIAKISPSGVVRPLANGQGEVVIDLAKQEARIPLHVEGVGEKQKIDFIRDVNPVISQMGCNAGTCHGARAGKNGFKLSLRGYDALLDVRAFTDDLASRRTNIASPDDSLMLLKATGAVPHVGGQLTTQNHPYYQIVRSWIADGAKLNTMSTRVTGIEVFPKNPVVQSINAKQQVRVVATYADGTSRDVTHEAIVTSGNTEVATIDDTVLLTAVRRGEAPILARYEGAYAATTLTVMGDRTGFVWQQPPVNNRIDELTAAKWERMKIQPSELCTDAEFIRRVYLDLTGLPPTADQVRKFLADRRNSKTKRDELIDSLIGTEEFIDKWTNKWADLLQVNRKFLGPEGAAAFRKWIRDEVANNTPYDEFATKILTASGSNKENPAASYYKILRDPLDTMENTTHLFLGVRFNCNKCHDHPFERWTQDQYYETAAYFAQVGLKADPAGGKKKKIGGTAVEGAKPYYEIVYDKPDGEVVHDRTKEVTPPRFPYQCDYDIGNDATRREKLSSWITSPDNQYFARSYVNRLWGYLLGVGIIEPIDDIRAGNPPSNPELLDYLTEEFIASDFNVRHIMQLITKSRTYQLSIATNQWNEDDTVNYSHATARRLPAEVLFDAIHHVTGSTPRIPGVPAGTRANQIPDAGIKLPSGFLGKLGRPARESACECERVSGLQLGPVMALVSGPTVGNAIGDPNNELAKLVSTEKDDQKLINEVFLRIANRPATDEEIKAGIGLIQGMPEEHKKLVAMLRDLEEELAPSIAAKEKRRQEKIDAAQAALSAYEKEIAPREAELDKAQQEKIAKADAAVKEHLKQLPAKQAAWEKQIKQPTVWTALDPIELKASNNAKLAKEKDLSVLASGANGKGNYRFVALTDLQDITGIRLELLADKRLPMNGPGRSASNGNFVLSEFTVQWAPEGMPKKAHKLVLQNAQADFSQEGYSITTAIDGKVAPTANGWASSPKLGVNRTAIFETKENIGTEAGQLTFVLDQQYQDGTHSIGKFRISVTNSPRPLRMKGLPKNIAEILAVAADKRNDKQKTELAKFYRSVDSELKKLEAALTEAKKPRPVDPKLKQLRDKLAEVSKPLPADPDLAQMRADVEISAKQLQNARLTAVQDLAWALINHPTFLFNR